MIDEIRNLDFLIKRQKFQSLHN